MNHMSISYDGFSSDIAHSVWKYRYNVCSESIRKYIKMRREKLLSVGIILNF